MKLTVLGCSPSFANAGGASSGYLVEAADTRLLVDCGHGVVGKLMAATDVRALSGIVISHMHPDHIFDLVPLKYAFLFQGIPPIPLLLPPGGLDVLRRLASAVGLAAAFFTHSFEVGEYDPSRELRLGALRLTLAPTQHYIQGYAMRFSANGRSLAYSSDTGPTESIPALLHGVQLALVEATLLQQANDDEPPGHLTGREAGALARQARVQRLLLTHYAASIAQRLLLDAKETFGPDAELAQEGKTYEV